MRSMQAGITFIAACVISAGAVAADTITFDELGAQPCLFSQTQPLTTEYSSRGVVFEGPQQGQGGAILDQCASFGVNARSGTNFLAFNTQTYARTPETIRFTNGAGRVEMYASPGSQSGSITVNAFNSSNNQVDTVTATLRSGSYILVEVSGNISYVVVTTTSPWLLIDDLSWDESGYNLRVSGQCPGTLTVSWSNATPSTQQGLVFGLSQGNTTIPTGVCQGTVLGIQGNVQLVNTFGTGSGSGSVSGPAGTAACGRFLQLVEAPSCNTSNVAQIPQ